MLISNFDQVFKRCVLVQLLDSLLCNVCFQSTSQSSVLYDRCQPCFYSLYDLILPMSNNIRRKYIVARRGGPILRSIDLNRDSRSLRFLFIFKIILLERDRLQRTWVKLHWNSDNSEVCDSVKFTRNRRIRLLGTFRRKFPTFQLQKKKMFRGQDSVRFEHQNTCRKFRRLSTQLN